MNVKRGTGVRGLTKSLGNLPPKVTKAFSGQSKVGNPPAEFEVNNSTECDTFSLPALTIAKVSGRPIKSWVLYCKLVSTI